LDLWIRLGMRNREDPLESIKCHGCASVQWCRYEQIRRCVRHKGLGTCGACAEFPCDGIWEVFRKTRSYEERCREVCSPEEYQSLSVAFFSKRKTLERINAKCF
jgi:hypothetical protein